MVLGRFELRIPPSTIQRRSDPGRPARVWRSCAAYAGTPPERFALEHAHYDEDLAFWVALAREIGGPVLDIGAAVGRVTIPIARLGHHVCAVDGSQGMLHALEAALAIQRALHARAWPDGCDVRLRIGLHRGRPTLTDLGYVGLAVHAAARICNAAHGGQIVMSSAVRAAIVKAPIEGVTARRLGAWRFHGLADPMDLYQVEAADLLADFPPPRSAVSAEHGR